MDRKGSSEYQIITFPAKIDNRVLVQLDQWIGEIIELTVDCQVSYNLVVFNFKKVRDIGPSLARELFQIVIKLNKISLEYNSMLIGPQVKMVFKEEGLIGKLNMATSLKEAMEDAGISYHEQQKKAQTVTFDVNVVNPIISSIIEVFESKLHFHLELESPRVQKKFSIPDAKMAVVSTINCQSFYGNITLIFTNEVYKRYISKIKEKGFIKNVDDVPDFTIDLLIDVFKKASFVFEDGRDTIGDYTLNVLHGYKTIAQEMGSSLAIRIPIISQVGPLGLLVHGAQSY